MSYLPISKIVPQYVDSSGIPYSGAVLKAYEPGTTTNISMATDTAGGTTATSIALNSQGFTTLGGSVVIPHLGQDYKLALYPTQTAADANSGAIWTVDAIPITDLGSDFVASETGTGDAYEIALTLPTGAVIQGQRFQFIASEANTGACTLNVNSLGAVSIKMLDGTDPYDDAIVASMLVDVQYDGTNFQLMNPNTAVNQVKGADIASATTTDLSTATGDFIDITGTTTITGFGTMSAGVKKTLQFDGSLTLTYNATSMILPGNVDIITQTGDIAEFISLGSGNWLCTNYQSDFGTPNKVRNWGYTIASFASPSTFPRGLAIDPATGNLISCDYGTDLIYIHSGISSTVSSSFASPSTLPRGLAIDPATGNLISCDYDAKLIYIHSGISSTVSSSFASPSTSPAGVAIDPATGNLISCDNDTDLIYIHDGISSTILSSFASPSTYPRELAIDPLTGNLISCDDDTNLIYIHDGISSTILSSFASPSTFPTGLAIDPATGNLISCDNGTDLIYIHLTQTV